MTPSDRDSSDSHATLNPAERGTPFGRFRLLGRVGTGDVAEVFRALVVGVEGFERRVAIKVMRGDVAESEVGSLFAEEARVSAQLDCAGVVQVYEFGVIEAAPYIAMEYVQGKNLADILVGLRAQGERLTPAMAVFVAMELAGALVHAHESEDNGGMALRIVHGGIHPANIMLGREGAVKLLDFGIWPVLTDPRSPVTREGRRVPPHAAYLAPEQARGEEIDERTDLFSLGVVLWEMLTGRPLFTGKSDRQTLKNVQQAAIPAPSSVVAGLPASLDEVVLTAMAREPARRYRSASALLRDLEEVALSLPRRHGDMAMLLDRLGGTSTESGSMRTLSGDTTARPRAPATRAPAILPAPRPHVGERTPTTKMLGDTTLAAILARDPRRRTTPLHTRLRADPRSLMVGAGGLLAGLLVAVALLTGRSKPIAHPTVPPTIAAPAVPRSPTVVAATPPAPAPCGGDAGPPCAAAAPPAIAPEPEPTVAAPRSVSNHRRRPSPRHSGGQVRKDDHRPNPF